MTWATKNSGGHNDRGLREKDWKGHVWLAGTARNWRGAKFGGGKHLRQSGGVKKAQSVKEALKNWLGRQTSDGMSEKKATGDQSKGGGRE